MPIDLSKLRASAAKQQTKTLVVLDNQLLNWEVEQIKAAGPGQVIEVQNHADVQFIEAPASHNWFGPEYAKREYVVWETDGVDDGWPMLVHAFNAQGACIHWVERLLRGGIVLDGGDVAVVALEHYRGTCDADMANNIEFLLFDVVLDYRPGVSTRTMYEEGVCVVNHEVEL